MKTDDTLIALADPALGADLGADLGAGLGADLAPYRLLREIGRGGMSVVYEALNTQTGQRVALKVLALPFAVTAARRTDLVARFRREARAVTQLSHPNIVTIEAIGERGGLHFIAMEYLPGESLRARLERGPLTLPEAAAILNQIAAALTAVHGAGIVHRDVKPSNVMLLPEGTVKLLDFGVARHADDTAITSGGLVVGSPAYLSPEQVRGGDGTAASDVWALGVLLSEMLAGHPPFRATDVAAVMYQVIHEPPRLAPGLPPAVAKVLKRALDKAPERRFPSAQALAEAFAAALPAEPALATASPRSSAASRSSAAPPRWAWATLPLFFLAALLWGLHERLPAPPALNAPQPPPASVPKSLAGAAPQAVPSRAAGRVPRAAAVRRSIADRTPPAALVRPATQASMRPRIVPRAASRTLSRTVPQTAAVVQPSAPRVQAEQSPVRRAAAAPSPPHPPVSAREETASAASPVQPAVSEPLPPPSRPTSSAPQSARPKHSKAEDEAAEAERLQKFIWSEGR